ncbi:MAG: hypothetical protein LBP63_07375 [Prevotellaceae bacterium]|jgi:hypothetical protein|nr:hypothetical protein [Prevotellaceae bacterium]
MKRISEFTADRMDMKQMAAISGAHSATSGGSTYYMGGCMWTETYLDDYYNHPTQGRTLYRHSYQHQSVCQ